MRRKVSEHLGAQIRAARRLAGMTQRELGDAVGEQHQTIQKLETGAVRIKADQLWRIARALGQGVDTFFAGLEDETPFRPERGANGADPAAQPAAVGKASDRRTSRDRSAGQSSQPKKSEARPRPSPPSGRRCL
jgi:transcriptional regulator with XRE-family HTH domain